MVKEYGAAMYRRPSINYHPVHWKRTLVASLKNAYEPFVLKPPDCILAADAQHHCLVCYVPAALWNNTGCNVLIVNPVIFTGANVVPF